MEIEYLEWNDNYTDKLEKAISRNIVVSDSDAQKGEKTDRLLQVLERVNGAAPKIIVDDPRLTEIYLEKYEGSLPYTNNQKDNIILVVKGGSPILGAY